MRKRPCTVTRTCKGARTKPAPRAVLLFFAIAGWSLGSATARAQTLQELDVEQKGLGEKPSADKWDVTLGIGAAVLPDFPGASSYRATPVPLVSITYDKRYFLSPRGLGMNAIDWNGFRAGPVLGYEGGRDESDDPHLNGLGNIAPSLTGGGFAAYRFAPFEISLTVRQSVTHTRNGLNGLAQIDYFRPLVPRKLILVMGPHIGLANREYEKTWFGVTPDQSAQSGLSTFSPGGGVQDVGFHASLTYYYTQHILVRGFADIKELAGDAADSPIVQNATQGLVGLGVAYHF